MRKSLFVMFVGALVMGLSIGALAQDNFKIGIDNFGQANFLPESAAQY